MEDWTLRLEDIYIRKNKSRGGTEKLSPVSVSDFLTPQQLARSHPLLRMRTTAFQAAPRLKVPTTTFA